MQAYLFKSKNSTNRNFFFNFQLLICVNKKYILQQSHNRLEKTINFHTDDRHGKVVVTIYMHTAIEKKLSIIFQLQHIMKISNIIHVVSSCLLDWEFITFKGKRHVKSKIVVNDEIIEQMITVLSFLNWTVLRTRKIYKYFYKCPQTGCLYEHWSVKTGQQWICKETKMNIYTI